jgi:hypothetical protein
MAAVSVWPTLTNQASALAEALSVRKDVLISQHPSDETTIQANYDARPATEDDTIAFYLWAAIVDGDLNATLDTFLYDGRDAAHFPGYEP